MFDFISRVCIAPSLVALALGCGAAADASAQAGNQGAAALDAGVDTGIAPGDDFFAHANGSWLQATTIPVGKMRWTARDENNVRVDQQLQALLGDLWTAPAGKTARQVADFRAACLDQAAIVANGLRPLKPLLGRIDKVRDKPALARLLGSMLGADADPINRGQFSSANVLGFAAESSIHGEKEYVAFLVQGGLGLPGREHYLSDDAAMQATRHRYQQALGKVLALLDPVQAQSAAQRAAAVMVLETALARSHATVKESDNERNADNLWTRADFAGKAPGMDWPAFFKAARLDKQHTLVAWQPGAVTGLAALVAGQPLQAWKDYLRVRALAPYLDVLPPAFADQAQALRGAADGPLPGSAEQRATALTQGAMAEAIGRLYVERYFPAAHKARLDAIVANVAAAFSRRIDGANWLSPASKATAQAKLKVLYYGMAYPEQWPDDAALVIKPADPVGNLQRLAGQRYRQALDRLGQPVDNRRWVAAPQQAGGLLMFQQNAYNFSAALLQSPKFDAGAPDAVNYGAIGAIVGHEMSHFVDTLGAEYEVDGRLRRWWTPDDVARYAVASEALERQFSTYRPYPDVAVNGKQTSSENVADLAGLSAAFDAYRATLGELAADKAAVRQQDRAFFLGFARAWRGKVSEEGLRTQLASDVHAPDRYRIATVRNLDAWYEAFDIAPGQQLYLAPSARVRVW